MKIHNGPCTGQPCSRAHAYKCRFCSFWFPQIPVLLGTDAFRLHPSPLYPYCSVHCALGAADLDPGYHMFEKNVKLGLLLVDEINQTNDANSELNNQLNFQYN